eukprot:Rmarinus@m.26822
MSVSLTDTPVSTSDLEDTLALVAELQQVYNDTSATFLAFQEETMGVWRNFFLFYGGMVVFFMQAGFAVLEAGSVRVKNTKNILLKNAMDAAIGCISWWVIGWPLAYGADEPTSEIAGHGDFLLSGDSFERRVWVSDNLYPDWFFQWAFAATAATIVSGGVAERCSFGGYLLYTTFITGFIYPMVCHWGWGGGFLVENGYTDFAGSGIVHLCGGTAALMGAIIVGPRTGRFGKDGSVTAIGGHSTPLVACGGFILWYAWFAFNGISTLEIYNGGMYACSRVAVVTALCGAGGTMSSALLTYLSTGQLDLAPVVNGALAGLVASSGPANVIMPWVGLVVGAIAAAVCFAWSLVLVKFRVDDPLDASSVHAGGGIVGVLAVGLFHVDSGLFYLPEDRDEMDSELLGWQVVGILTIAGFTAVTSGLLFLAIKHTVGLRVDLEVESLGLDIVKHGGYAYGLNTPRHEQDLSGNKKDYGHINAYATPMHSPSSKRRGNENKDKDSGTVLPLDNSPNVLISTESPQTSPREGNGSPTVTTITPMAKKKSASSALVREIEPPPSQGTPAWGGVTPSDETTDDLHAEEID